MCLKIEVSLCDIKFQDLEEFVSFAFFYFPSRALVPFSLPETCGQMSLKINYRDLNISEWNQLFGLIFLGAILS